MPLHLAHGPDCLVARSVMTGGYRSILAIGDAKVFGLLLTLFPAIQPFTMHL